MEKEKIVALVLAAGTGKRMQSSTAKQYMLLGGKPLVCYALEAFERSPVDEVILVTGEKEIEIKAVAALDLLVFDRMEEPIVSRYESEEVDWDAFRSAPGMVGYVVQEKETLWDIAKKFFTTVEAIMEVNQKETEQVQTGDMILILKEVS